MGGYIFEAINTIGKAIIRDKQMLTDLDAAIGDGDHGINMARGFEAVQAKMQALEAETDIGKVMKTIGMTLISSVGGASGPLYGTAFLRAAGPSQGKTKLDTDTASLMLAAAITGIKERGKAIRGEKTMLDALEPAYDAFMEGAKVNKTVIECLELACNAAQEGVEFTKTIAATKGRASYLGERSIGHQDAGATSSYIMLHALLEFLRGNN
ncbi:dihydroxyacetone kinase subunit DhaL [Pelosinus sp. IPA-1]|uniref:dihydroxyacetone kinase subunit DhaL n=1 Tax=Pelosinus sp. IPA-1 TaxID=3029569 RepID=UPI0024361C04|nr:dihydroxyacetone kinase subunit DhaL [Pelosinus sp. IPA-1]GMB02194.1 dihydroxyacetone kinase subunit L [Pelosinus sp. IPA-1]